MNKLIPWLIYPVTMALCLATYFALVAAHAPTLVAMYVPAFLGAGLVTLLEWRFPHRRAWHPDATTLTNDLAYMTLVQMLLPPGVALLFVLVLVEPLHGLGLPALWPQAWPVWAQAVLMLFAADFLRYWLHRASHRWSPLWALHAVHHSPHRLYWLNVGRFHPLEKALQMTADTLPFLLLGVTPEVVALYFAFYAVNGFFQHSNVAVRLGLLNWLISGPELHRWHHSRLPDESDRNFGNNVIVWDTLFGTRFLPAGRECKDLGLLNRHYPTSLVEQLRTPFIPLLSKRPVALPPWPRAFRALARPFKQVLRAVAMAVIAWHDWRPLARTAQDPATAQANVLRRLITQHRDSGFGRAHDYAAICNTADFRARVTVQHYDDLAPWITAQQHGEPGLTTDAPMLYALTSGTTGAPKYLPVITQSLAQHRRGQRLYTLLQYRACPEAFAGRALGLVGATEEGRTPEGVPIGSVSGALYAAMPEFMRRRYVAPPEVFALADYDLKYRTLAQLALREPRLSYIAAANPSSLLRLQGVLESEREALIAGVASGHFAGWETFSFELREALSVAAVPLPERVAQLAALERFDFAQLWPELKLIATWTGGSCGIALAKLRERLPPDCQMFDIGYLSTEFRGTLTLAPERTAGLPLVDEHFYEFVERDAWDAGKPVFLGLHELRENTLYYVIVSTVSGLPRYFMNDLVQVDGWHAKTPLLRFVQKGRGVTSITGEKLYEGQFLDAMAALGNHAPFYLLTADEAASRYRLYLEATLDVGFADRLDTALAERNVEYRDKRASGRLAPLEVVALKPGTGDAYKQHLIAHGQREGQFKFLAVQYTREVTFDFRKWQA